MPRKTKYNSSGLGVSAAKGNTAVNHMLKFSWKRRFRKMNEQYVYKMANSLLEGAKKRIPSTPDYKEYAKSMVLAKIQGEGGYAITAMPKRKSKSQLDNKRTLVYFRAARKTKRPSGAVVALVEYGPWSLDTVPYFPTKREAVATYRKVSEREVALIEKKLASSQRKWSREFRRTNISTKKRNQGKVKFSEDLAFTSLRLEFGQGASKPKPHWRPAVSDMRKIQFPQLLKDKNMTRAISEPNYKDWLSWPPKTTKTISGKMAKSFNGFAKKLGIK